MQSNRSSTAKRRLLFAVVLAVPLFLTSGVSNQLHNALCTTSTAINGQISPNCVTKQSANNSWLRWFSGGSRSTQFQFIDLFELVHGDKDNSRKTVIPTREG